MRKRANQFPLSLRRGRNDWSGAGITSRDDSGFAEVHNCREQEEIIGQEASITSRDDSGFVDVDNCRVSLQRLNEARISL
ncbi:hypothetical protein CEXT_225551 [Caerostris extrusa]|uniref:Uncharacterized protein n=1 Tax=Caerostris extrusa TaxID=172846 RepID=A0AAV4PPM9_CAEEX|nr:hypothetical protein CEXT_225551 [Caerostris extrusa]